MTVREYALVVERRKWLIVVATAASILVSLIVSFMQTTIYESTSQVLVRSRNTSTIFTNTQMFNFSPLAVVPTEIQLLESELVALRVQEDLGLEGPLPPVRGSQIGVTDVVNAKVRSSNAVTAKVLADAYVKAYIAVKKEQAVDGLLSGGEQLSLKLSEIETRIDEIDQEVANAPIANRADVQASRASERKLLVDQQAVFKAKLDQLQIDSQLADGGAQMLRVARVSNEPVAPKPMDSALFALVVGLLLGLGAAFLIDYLDNSVRSPEELERFADGIPLLGVIHHEVPPDTRPLSISRPKSWTVENYRGLRTSLQFLSLDRDIRIVQFVSPGASEGKSTTAVNTAIAFAQAGFRTLLIDADLRKPVQHSFFGLTPESGLVDVLVGSPFASCVVRIIPNLDLLEAGTQPPNPSEMLSSRQMSRLLDDMRSKYDMVIIDSSPILLVSDGVGLSSSVDAVVLVAREGRTSGSQVESAVARLRSVDAPLVGTVFNDVVRRKKSMYGYGYGYGTTAPAAPKTDA